MQTFLPLPDFETSARTLDNKRLGKQRVECKQILNALLNLTDPDGVVTSLLGKSKGWRNHPATKMWRGHEQSLCRYAIVVCKVWREKGFKDSLLPFFQEMHDTLPACDDPPWLGGSIHASHRSNLLRKDASWYGQFGWTESADLPYVWPV